MKWLTAFLAAFILLFSLHAEAGRLAGGKSMGRQSGNVIVRPLRLRRAWATQRPNLAPRRRRAAHGARCLAD